MPPRLSVLCLRVKFGGSLHAAIDKGNDLCTGAGIVGAEQAAADTAGDAVLLRPCNRCCVVCVSRYVAESGIAADSGAAACAPQEGNDLRTGAGSTGADGR